MRKALFSIVINLILIMAITVSVSASSSGGAKIIAGQKYWVGYVNVWGNPDGSLDFKLDTISNAVPGWCITDAAIHVAKSLTDFPQNKGGAIPGKFAYKYDFGGCVTEVYPIHIDKGNWEHGDQLYIAVHTNVSGPNGQQETGWAVLCGQLQATQFPGKNWSAYFILNPDTWFDE